MSQPDSNESSRTHFGFQTVSPDEKTSRVGQVFDSVSNRYDVMNDLMSMGLHRLWKRIAIQKSRVRRGHVVLDLAAGTGDMTRHYLKQVGQTGEVVASDINESMLARAKARLTDEGFVGNVQYVIANAEALPFPDHHFDCVNISFGLRNVTHPERALQEMYRVLKPGGIAVILEFSKPTHPVLSRLYDWYSFRVIPKMGEWVTGDRDSYQYLVESIRMHPDQETLKQNLLQAGFDEADYDNLTQGVVAVHLGFKY